MRIITESLMIHRASLTWMLEKIQFNPGFVIGEVGQIGRLESFLWLCYYGRISDLHKGRHVSNWYLIWQSFPFIKMRENGIPITIPNGEHGDQTLHNNIKLYESDVTWYWTSIFLRYARKQNILIKGLVKISWQAISNKSAGWKTKIIEKSGFLETVDGCCL